MKVGTLCYATDSGLGILAKSFYDHGVVTHPVVVRHGKHQTHEDWYPGAPVLGNLDLSRIGEVLPDVDVMLFFETPFVWPLVDYCRKIGVKTALMVMHECLHQEVWRHKPDLFLCPSDLDDRVVEKELYERRLGLISRINVPVEVPWRQRTRVEVFVHNAGHGGLRGRNGTKELIEALPLIKSNAKVMIRSQGSQQFSVAWSVLENETLTYDGLWKDGGLGDVFVFPEKFNGLSLPLQEARAAGMLVMGTNRFPMNRWLPTEPLVPSYSFTRQRIGAPYTEFDEAVVAPQDIAAAIDRWYGRDITEYSLAGRRWAEENSWAALGPKYKAILEELC